MYGAIMLSEGTAEQLFDISMKSLLWMWHLWRLRCSQEDAPLEQNRLMQDDHQLL